MRRDIFTIGSRYLDALTGSRYLDALTGRMTADTLWSQQPTRSNQ